MDDKLRLICGIPITVDGFELKPYTIKEIVSIGYSRFMSMIGMLCFDTDYFLKELRGEDFYMELYEKKHELEPLEFYLMFSNSEDFRRTFTESLSLALRINVDNIYVNVENRGILITSNEDGKLIDGNTYDKIVDVLKYQNGMKSASKDSEDDENPADDKAKAILDRIKSSRERVNQAKAEEGEGSDIDLFDIISAVSVRSNSINKLNINDLTIFQLYNEFARLQNIDAYENYLKASMVGAKLEGKAPHWSDKI